MEQKVNAYELAQLRCSEANLEQLLAKRLTSGNLSDALYEQRIGSIKKELGIDGIFTVDEEDPIINELKNRLLALSKAISRQFDYSKDIEPECQQILKCIHAYVLFRMQALQLNLDPNNAYFYAKNKNSRGAYYQHPVIGMYQIIQTFDEYRTELNNSIGKYQKSELFKKIMSLLEKSAPLLLKKPVMLTDIHRLSQSALSCPQTKFFAPPYLNEIANVAEAIGSIITNKGKVDLTETIATLNTFSDTITAQSHFNSVSTIVSKVVGSVEILAQVTPQQINQQNRSFILQCCSMGMALSRYFNHHLISVSPDAVTKSQKVIMDSNSSLDQKITATRLIIHSQMPWYLLRNFGLLQYYISQSKLNRPQMQSIIESSMAGLSADYKKILCAVKFLLHFEIEAAKGQIIELPPHSLISAPLITLDLFGNYGADLVFSIKIRDTLNSLDLTKPLEATVLLRIIGILGECAKNISEPFIQLANQGFWESVKVLRDILAHKKSVELKIKRILKNDQALTMAIQSDLKEMCNAVCRFIDADPQHSVDIKKLYLHPPCKMIQALERLNTLVVQKLSAEDKQELLDTVKFQPVGLEMKRDTLLALFHGNQKADQFEQAEIFTWTDSLYMLSKSLRKKIKESYKRLRSGNAHKLNQDALLKLAEVQTESEEAYAKHVNDLIGRLQEFVTPESLTAALEEIGLKGSNPIWEQKRLQCAHSPVLQSDIIVQKSPYELAQIAATYLLAHLADLDQLTKSHRKDLNIFWSNPQICLAAEHHFVMIRQYIADIQKALLLAENYQISDPRQNALNALYRLTDESLYSLRLYGNGLAHLHDMINFQDMTMTVHGNRLLLLQRIIAGVDGSALKSGETPIVLASLRAKIEASIAELKKRIEQAKPQSQNPQGFHHNATTVARVAVALQNSNNSPHN